MVIFGVDLQGQPFWSFLVEIIESDKLALLIKIICILMKLKRWEFEKMQSERLEVESAQYI